MRYKLDLRWEGEIIVHEVHRVGKGIKHTNRMTSTTSRDDSGYRWLYQGELLEQVVANHPVKNRGSEQGTGDPQ